MSQRLDWVGRRYGRLVVIEHSHTKRWETSKQTLQFWRCCCDCGNVAIVSASSLGNGATKSCGCIRREQAAKNAMIGRSNWGLSKTHEYALWSSAKERAKRLGRDFDIEVFDIKVPDKCPILGILLERGKGKQHAASPTLDRIDSTKGYTRDNICVISQRANSLKQDATIEQLELIIKYMKGELKDE